MNDLLDAAEEVLSMGEICDFCLGRRFARLSYGLSNGERGRALRTSVYLRNDEEYSENEDCWVCDGAFDELGFWVDEAEDKLSGLEFDGFLVGCNTPPLVEENEKLLDDVVDPELKQNFGSDFNMELGKRLEGRVDAEVEFETPDVVAVADLQENEVELQVNPIYVYGRYRKLERGIPQTEWPCRDCGGRGCDRCDGTGYMYEDSVEELVRPYFMENFDGERFVFHGAGREDVDALMLGRGRPFVAEIKEPRVRDVDLESIEDSVNTEVGDKVEVTDLSFVGGDAVERVKKADADKRYRATVRVEGEIEMVEIRDALQEIEGKVEQRTPERVNHRRADKIRERNVLDAELLAKEKVAAGDSTREEVPESHDGYESGSAEGDLVAVEFECEGGLYVKELVSGDNGRTEPSLTDLVGVEMEVDDLDVVDVVGDFPG
ncbi:MAG: tRNA pseudouridine(54/55) synthase Pus10 [Halobacteria archaeon]